MGIGFLGIDIAKSKFDAALLINGKFKCKEFKNEFSGFQALITWLERYESLNSHACMEATGAYSEALATYLHEKEIMVSVINPAQIKRFGGCKLTRNKTDKGVRRLEALQSMRQQDYNRKGTAFLESIQYSIEENLTFLDRQIEDAKNRIKQLIQTHKCLAKKRELLESIPGIGEATIAQVLAFFGNTEDFQSAKELIAFLGLNPRQYQSGTSVHKNTRISKVGDSSLRKTLYMPAIVGKKHNPLIKEFYERLVARGKPKKAAIVSSMRKLVHIIYGVLKNEEPFDQNWESTTVVVSN